MINFKTLLTADVSAAGAVLTVSSTDGWRAGDELCIASTTQTATQCEKRTIQSVDSSTQITVGTSVTNAHSGTSPTQGEIGNLTRNIKIRGIGTNAPSTTTTLQSYINIANLAIVVIRHAQFYYLGSATSLKRGFDIATTTGTFDMQYSSIVDCWISSSLGINISSASGSSITFSNNVIYNMHTASFTNVATTGTQIISNNLFMLTVSGGVVAADAGSTYSNNTIVGTGGVGLTFSELSDFGVCSGNTVHSCGSTVRIQGASGGTCSNLTVWRCPNSILIRACSNVTFDTFVCFGMLIANIQLDSGPSTNITFLNLTSNGDTSFPTINGIHFLTKGIGFVAIIENGNFSSVSGIKTAHTNDLNFSGTSIPSSMFLRNTILGGTNQIATQSGITTNGFVSAQKLGAVAGTHKTWMQMGTITIDTTIYKTALPSLRMTPTDATVKLPSAPLQYGLFKKVNNNSTTTISVYVRESLVANEDASTYNGNRARLIVRKNIAAGISADTVLATATANSSGNWELLTGTTAVVTDDAVLEFIVDCDGTTGWINIDDFDNDNLKNWSDGLPFNTPYLENISTFS